MLSFPLLLVLVGVAGALRGPGDAGKAAMTPEIARVAQVPLERVTGLAGAIERTSTMVGAALAGLLVAAVGAANALYVDAASFVVSFVVFGLATTGMGRPVPREETSTAPEAHGAVAAYLRELREGWDFLRTEPVLVAVCLMVAVTNLVDQAWTSVLVAGVGQGLRRGRGGAGRALRGDERGVGARRAGRGAVGRDAAALPHLRASPSSSPAPRASW